MLQRPGILADSGPADFGRPEGFRHAGKVEAGMVHLPGHVDHGPAVLPHGGLADRRRAQMPGNRAQGLALLLDGGQATFGGGAGALAERPARCRRWPGLPGRSRPSAKIRAQA